MCETEKEEGEDGERVRERRGSEEMLVCATEGARLPKSQQVVWRLNECVDCQHWTKRLQSDVQKRSVDERSGVCVCVF